MDVFSPLFASELLWTIPIMGVAVFGLAVLIGRHVFAAKPLEEKPEVELDTRFLEGVTQDRRAAPRRKGNVVEVQILEGDNPAIRGTVLDRSQGGLRIVVTRPVAEGTVLKVKPTQATITTPWTEILVKTCVREGADYSLGCQFRSMPNTALLLQFG